MKFCKNCGAKNFDANQKCEKCNQPFLKFPTIKPPSGVAIAAKIFLLISMIERITAFVVSFILWFVALCSTPQNKPLELKLIIIVLLICMIAFMILAIIAIIFFNSYNNKLYSGEKISTSLKICTLIFVNVIAGILMLCDTEKKAIVIQAAYQPQKTSVVKMKEYKELLDDGIITQEEFDRKKKEILGL